MGTTAMTGFRRFKRRAVLTAEDEAGDELLQAAFQ